MLFEVLNVSWRHSLEQVQLSLGHRLHDKLPIVGEKEETARTASALASSEDHVAIEFWAQALVEVGEVVNAPSCVKVLEVINHVEGHFDLGIDYDVVVLCCHGVCGPLDPGVLYEVLVA